MKTFAVQFGVFAAVLFGVGLITGSFARGWAVDLAYGSLATYPLYLAWGTKAFRPILMTLGLWGLGRVFQFADPKTMYSFAIASYGLLAIYYVKLDDYRCATVAGATVFYGVVFAIVNPSGVLAYLMQVVWNLLYVALLHLPLAATHGKEKGTRHRYSYPSEDFKKAA